MFHVSRFTPVICAHVSDRVWQDLINSLSYLDFFFDSPLPTLYFSMHLPLGPETSDVSILGDNTQTIPSRMTRTRDALQMPQMRYVLATIPTTLPNRMVGKVRVVIGTVVGQAYHPEPSPWPAAIIESMGDEDAGSEWPEGLKEHSYDFSKSTEQKKQGNKAKKEEDSEDQLQGEVAEGGEKMRHE